MIKMYMYNCITIPKDKYAQKRHVWPTCSNLEDMCTYCRSIRLFVPFPLSILYPFPIPFYDVESVLQALLQCFLILTQ